MNIKTEQIVTTQEVKTYHSFDGKIFMDQFACAAYELHNRWEHVRVKYPILSSSDPFSNREYEFYHIKNQEDLKEFSDDCFTLYGKKAFGFTTPNYLTVSHDLDVKIFSINDFIEDAKKDVESLEKLICKCEGIKNEA